MGRPPKKKPGRPKKLETEKKKRGRPKLDAPKGKPGRKPKAAKPLPKQKPKKKKSVLPDLLTGKFVIEYNGEILMDSGEFLGLWDNCAPMLFDSKEAAKECANKYAEGDTFDIEDFIIKPLSKIMAQSYEISIEEENKVYVSLVPKDKAVSIKAAIKIARQKHQEYLEEHKKALRDAQSEYNKKLKQISDDLEEESKLIKLDIKNTEKGILNFEKQMARMV
jgi:hypothetical protein